MTDWYGLVYNAVWVLGLAVIVAVLAMASFQTRVRGVRFRQVLRTSTFLLPFGVGMFLFCVGVFFSSRTWWEKLLWGLLAFLFAGQVIWLWRDRSGEGMGGEQGTLASNVDKPVENSMEERGQ